MAFEGVTVAPLAWPEGWPRTEYPERSHFTMTMESSMRHLLDELIRLGAGDIVVSTNVSIRRDGLPYASHRNPDDPGVAVYFTLNGEQRCIPCDKWTHVKDNIRAIGKTVEAIRGIGRWGASEMMNAAFTGFQSLPASSEQGWWTVLGVERSASPEDVGRAYREAARRTHPDTSGDGDHVEFLRVKAAWDQAMEELATR